MALTREDQVLKPAHWPGRLRAGSLLAAGTAGSLLLLSAVAPAGAATGPSGAVRGLAITPARGILLPQVRLKPDGAQILSVRMGFRP